jgi:hypothetical protein
MLKATRRKISKLIGKELVTKGYAVGRADLPFVVAKPMSNVAGGTISVDVVLHRSGDLAVIPGMTIGFRSLQHLASKLSGFNVPDFSSDFSGEAVLVLRSGTIYPKDGPPKWRFPPHETLDVGLVKAIANELDLDFNRMRSFANYAAVLECCESNGLSPWSCMSRNYLIALHLLEGRQLDAVKCAEAEVVRVEASEAGSEIKLAARRLLQAVQMHPR